MMSAHSYRYVHLHIYIYMYRVIRAFLNKPYHEVGTVEINTFCSIAVWLKMLG